MEKVTKIIIIFLIIIILILGGILAWTSQQKQIEDSYQKGLNDGLVDSFDGIFDNIERITTITVEGKGLIIAIPKTE